MTRKEYENQLNSLLEQIQELEKVPGKRSSEKVRQLRTEVARTKLENLKFSNVLR
jgi:hypothetical protein